MGTVRLDPMGDKRIPATNGPLRMIASATPIKATATITTIGVIRYLTDMGGDDIRSTTYEAIMHQFIVTFTRTTRDSGTFTVHGTDEEARQLAEQVLSDVMAAEAEEDIAQRLREHGGAFTDATICWGIKGIR